MNNQCVINGNIRKKAQGLLDMDYKPSELAEELGVTAMYIRKVLIAQLGAPNVQTEQKRIWINGLAFRTWINEYEKQQKTMKKNRVVAENDFYCVKCRKLVHQDLYTLMNDGRNTMKKAYCPICGTRINKYLKKGELAS